MGLDISAGGYGFRAGSYSYFNAFRDWIARNLGFAGINAFYEQMDKKYGSEWNHRNGHHAKANFMPLGYLLEHSDCDGRIPVHGARKIHKELVEFKSHIKEHDAGYEEVLDHWIVACQEAIDTNEPIYFG
jgi:hypothetical protein